MDLTTAADKQTTRNGPDAFRQKLPAFKFRQIY